MQISAVIRGTARVRIYNSVTIQRWAELGVSQILPVIVGFVLSPRTPSPNYYRLAARVTHY